MTYAPWPVRWPCCVDDKDPAVVEMARQGAQNLLWALSGRVYGVCDYDEGYYAPCACQCRGPWKDAWGNWRNGCWPSACCRLLLAHRPIQAVTSVTLNGTVLDPAAYQWGTTYLQRLMACWPCAPSCDPPPIRVQYRAGMPLDDGVAAAVGEVACELLAAFEDQPCKLPSRTVSVSRQGVTVNLDQAQPVGPSRLGLPLADAWLMQTNPQGLVQRSRVYSPDLARRA